MKAYQVIGWYPNIRREDRSSRNLSDGAIFSTPQLASQYALSTWMAVCEIRVIEGANRPDIDYYIREGIWTPTDGFSN